MRYAKLKPAEPIERFASYAISDYICIIILKQEI